MKKNIKSIPSIRIINRKASFDYTFYSKHIAGIVLIGSEVKSIKIGRANLKDAYCFFNNNELWLHGMHITPYQLSDKFMATNPKRPRKLLLHRNELNRLKKEKQEKGLTIVVKEIFISEKGWIKAQIVLAKGKKLYDKRASIKAKDQAREIAKEIRS